jgi:DNA modification methylase
VAEGAPGGPLAAGEHSAVETDSGVDVAYATKLGTMLLGTAEAALRSPELAPYQGKVQLIFTSPPFPLNRKKRYGNLLGDEYSRWLESMAVHFRKIINPQGSIVIELGNAWEAQRPVMSTLALEVLLNFKKAAGLQLCQTFVAHNPARLPSPAQWVNIERIRVKDAYTNIWWMSPSDRPFADNRQVLVPYSDSMRELLTSGRYNSGRRPSQHDVGQTSFLTDNSGAIPSNVLRFSNTSNSDRYQTYCRQHGYGFHPARMPKGIAEFFIQLLTRPGDLVFDPFAGSNTTGAAAEDLGRRWLSVEPQREYVLGSRGRFDEISDRLGESA